MVVWSTVMASRVAAEARFDGEYFGPRHLEMDAQLQRMTTVEPLGRLAKSLKKGIFDISPQRYRDRGVPLVRTLQIKSPLLSQESLVRIDAGDHEREFQRTQLLPGDIVLTKIGAGIGDVALLPADFDRYNFSQNVAGASLDGSRIAGPYLLAFLMTKWGRQQLRRYMMPSGQGKLELRDIRKIKIVRLGAAEDAIGMLVTEAQTLARRSRQEFSQANELFAAEFDPSLPATNQAIGYVARFSAVTASQRFDAGYFQPQHAAIRSLLQSYPGGCERLADCCDPLRSNIDPAILPQQEFNYIELSNIDASLGMVDGAFTGRGDQLPSRARRQVAAGDVIASAIVGSIDKAAIIAAGQDGFVASTGFFHLRPRTVPAEYLLVLVRSKLVQQQFHQQATGGILSAVPDNRLQHVIVPKAPREFMERITELVRLSHTDKRRSEALLEQARTDTETLIAEQLNPTSI